MSLLKLDPENAQMSPATISSTSTRELLLKAHRWETVALKTAQADPRTDACIAQVTTYFASSKHSRIKECEFVPDRLTNMTKGVYELWWLSARSQRKGFTNTPQQ